ncbi:unnamed protein product [Sphagnum balticum]
MPTIADNELIDISNEDEITPITNFIRNTHGVANIMEEEKSKMKEQIGKSKDQPTCMEGDWIGAKVKKTINGIYNAPKIGQPTLVDMR